MEAIELFWISNISFSVSAILRVVLPQLLELVLQHLGFLRGQGPDVLSYGGLDPAAGEVGLEHIDLVFALPGAQELPADRDLEGRALPAAGRIDIADARAS